MATSLSFSSDSDCDDMSCQEEEQQPTLLPHGGHICNWSINMQPNDNNEGCGRKCSTRTKDDIKPCTFRGLIGLQSCDFRCCPNYWKKICMEKRTWSDHLSACANIKCDRMRLTLKDRRAIVKDNIKTLLPGFSLHDEEGNDYHHISNQSRREEPKDGEDTYNPKDDTFIQDADYEEDGFVSFDGEHPHVRGTFTCDISNSDRTVVKRYNTRNSKKVPVNLTVELDDSDDEDQLDAQETSSSNGEDEEEEQEKESKKQPKKEERRRTRFQPDKRLSKPIRQQPLAIPRQTMRQPQKRKVKSLPTPNKRQKMDYPIDSIEDVKIEVWPRDGQKWYLIKWEGYEDKDNTWEPESNLTACFEALCAFYKKRNQQITPHSSKLDVIEPNSKFDTQMEIFTNLIDGETPPSMKIMD